MIQATIFAGHDGELRFDKAFYLTLFGGTDLIRPTMARRILMQREDRRFDAPRRKPFFLTVFAGVEIKAPTLAAEFIDLTEMLKSGALVMADWDRALSELGRSQDSIATLTLFAGFDECVVPSEEEEIDSLAIQCHLGNIADSARQVLQAGIGLRDSERRAIVRRAVHATV